MARTFHVYVDPAVLPDRAALQAAIKGLGFRLTLDEAYAPFEVAGYLPCTLEGEDAGVDMRFERDAGLPDSVAAQQLEQAARRAVMRLRWGGDPREQLSALIVAGALAQDFDALVIDPDKGTLLGAAALLRQARELVDEQF